jgi:hypothetical protein
MASTPYRNTLIAAHWRSSTWQLWLAAFTVITFLLQGYHPLAEDGGLYVAGIEWKLNPTLFPHDAPFVTEHLRFSIFAPTIATLTRITHLSLPWCLLLVDLLALWLTLYAAHQLLRRCLPNETAQLAGIALFAAWSTLPVAATALLLTDPYLTARSLSTPLSLLAIAFALDNWKASRRSLVLCLICLTLSALFHPLMTAYAIGIIVPLRLLRLKRYRVAFAVFALAAIAVAAGVQALAPPESPALIAAELTRDYWFLTQWHWYELLGILGPLAVLAILQARLRQHLSPAAITLCQACITAGVLATLIAAMFAHEHFATHLVARMQPLRAFLSIYLIMTLLLGAVLTQLCLEYTPRFSMARAAPAFALLVIAAAMFAVQRNSFTASRHLELPWRSATNPNPWVQAFLWIRANTPRDALFAIDADYITTPGEDAHTFRSIARRSVLPDHSKDGGEASITPALAEAWQRGAIAQQGLSALSDTARDARLQPLTATWMVLHSTAITTHICPYNNGVVKVCRLDP